jgi:hypothetical protein
MRFLTFVLLLIVCGCATRTTSPVQDVHALDYPPRYPSAAEIESAFVILHEHD